MVLPPESAKLIDLYVNRYRARICSGPNPWLFPTTDGHKRNVTSFSRALGEFVKKETGLVMHSHLFRQLAGKLHLDAHPGDIETVRQVLNHKHSSTTLRFYIEQRTIQGFRTYDATVAGLRGSWDFGNASQEAGQ
jgi:integrase